MDGHAGDATLNPRVGNGLAYFLRTGQLRRFMVELRANRRLSGKSLWRTLYGDVGRKMAPPWVKRFGRAVRRGFKPVWHDKGIAPEFARRLLETGDVEARDILGWTWDSPEMRDLVVLSLHAWTARYRTSEANEAASHGLELTRPLADRRVVEFGLAIPEELYVKDGIRRYLATRALADVYPVEFQTRRPRQDVLDPAVDEMYRNVQPRLKTELERMAASPVLRSYFDFDVLSRDLEKGPATYTASGFDLRTFLAAAYVAWFNGKN
jgi:asparagine synthase (glutamine-hydrolysing)